MPIHQNIDFLYFSGKIFGKYEHEKNFSNSNSHSRIIARESIESICNEDSDIPVISLKLDTLETEFSSWEEWHIRHIEECIRAEAIASFPKLPIELKHC
jgi:hypothetical protein